MREILILSGKGGTGKTSITAAFSFFLEKNDIIVDCDVDAADMHILLAPDKSSSFDFYSGKECRVVEKMCNLCNICVENCHYHAISIRGDSAYIDPLECEKCLLCYNLCPQKAIEANENRCGEYYISNTRLGKKLVHAVLEPGADNSGKLVSTVRTTAKIIAKESNSNTILIDGPPGIACPVIAAMSGVNFVVLVTEPTISGFSDLQRVAELINHFKIRSGCIINKASINREIKRDIERFCGESGIELLGEIPYSKKFYQALVQKRSVVETDEELRKSLESIWFKINQNRVKESVK